jgi:hypothetical protein
MVSRHPLGGSKARRQLIAMSRRSALTTQADINRALRAARQAGAAFVEIQPDGRITIRLDAPPIAPKADDDEPVIL